MFYNMRNTYVLIAKVEEEVVFLLALVFLLADSREDPVGAEVRWQQHTWASQLELDDATIPWDASVWEF